MDWAFLFLVFLKHAPNRSSQKKKKERKIGVCLGAKKHVSLFPKVVFLSKARKGGGFAYITGNASWLFFLFFLRCLDFIFVCRLLLAPVAKICCWSFQYKCVFLEFRVTKRLAFHISLHISVAVQFLLDKLDHVK